MPRQTRPTTPAQPAAPQAPIARVEIKDFEAFGRKVEDWSLNPANRPKTLAELAQQCSQMITIPARITKLEYIDLQLDTLTIRVPNPEMMKEAKKRFEPGGPSGQGGFPAPSFYATIGTAAQPQNLVIMYSRIADYQIGQCG